MCCQEICGDRILGFLPTVKCNLRMDSRVQDLCSAIVMGKVLTEFQSKILKKNWLALFDSPLSGIFTEAK